jgi:class 3 adenylate cyclase
MNRSHRQRLRHLENIVAKHNRTANVQVVFIDVEKYSRRRSQVQIALIDRFTGLLHDALAQTGAVYADYARINELRIADDVLLLPTGDGAGVLFSFEGLHDIHLCFARTLLRLVHETNTADGCAVFDENGWCNCHPSFSVRIGISEGKAIFYRDVNKRLNVAGRTVNLAARVMSVADRSQILFTEDAFQQLADLTNDAALVENFRIYPGVHLKDGERITVYQYLGTDEDYVNSAPVVGLGLKAQFDAAARLLSGASRLPQNLPDAGRSLLGDLIHGVANAVSSAPDDSGNPYLEPRRRKHKE